ncbi:chalcone isomerase family protein [Oceanisphaera sp. W20_SRM_FM3]|uniref:chalcone isomerase family protein n=1 Tax=Oceanisphaera sp. W20_SRM_FM3 TaxID=3240267 RepID=UPI003F9E6CF2
MAKKIVKCVFKSVFLKQACLLLLSSLLAFQVHASAHAGLQLVGKGQMRWMLFDLYQAQLYSTDGRYQAGRYPQALRLLYQKNISRDALIEATETEWQRLDIKAQPSWSAQLRALWPNVKKGNELAIRVETSGISRFYFNQVPLGEITDPAFGPAFLAIWLSKNSLNPSLTRQLKGN